MGTDALSNRAGVSVQSRPRSPKSDLRPCADRYLVLDQPPSVTMVDAGPGHGDNPAMLSESPATTPARARRLTKRGADTRARILDATIACIVSSGTAGMTIEDVLAATGISRGSVLHQFPTRNLLLIAAAERAMTVVIEDAGRLASEIEDPFDRLADYAEIVWVTHAMPEGVALTDILQATRWDRELSQGIQPIAARVEAEVERELVKLAADAGVEDPRVMVPRGWMLISTARGLTIEHTINSNRRMILEAIAEMKRSHRRYCEALVSPERRRTG